MTEHHQMNLNAMLSMLLQLDARIISRFHLVCAVSYTYLGIIHLYIKVNGYGYGYGSSGNVAWLILQLNIYSKDAALSQIICLKWDTFLGHIWL